MGRYRRSGIEVLADALAELTIAVIKGIIRLFRRSPQRPPAYLPPAQGALPVVWPDSKGTKPPTALQPTQSAPPPDLSSLLPPDLAEAPATVQEELPYRRATHLLTKGEQAFWRALYQAVKGRYRIFCKVRLADIAVPTPASRRDERRWFRKIGNYHVDFVLCEPHTTAPLLVIELDDRTHHSARRRKQDQFKQDVLAAARMPLYRVRARRAYNSARVAQRIDGLIAAGRIRP